MTTEIHRYRLICHLDDILQEKDAWFRDTASNIGEDYETISKFAASVPSYMTADIIKKVCVDLDITPGQLLSVQEMDADIPKHYPNYNAGFFKKVIREYMTFDAMQQDRRPGETVLDRALEAVSEDIFIRNEATADYMSDWHYTQLKQAYLQLRKEDENG